MSSSSKSLSHVAHVEDADDESGGSINGIEGTRKYATSEAPLSPSKERPNTSKSRSDKRPVNARSSPSNTDLFDADRLGNSTSKRDKPLSRRPSEKDCGDPEQRAREREKRRQERRAKEEEEDRRALGAESQGSKDGDAGNPKKTRPTSLNKSYTQPVVQQVAHRRAYPDDPANYGIQQTATSRNRPRAQSRPASYYAGQQPSRPPPVNTGWYLHNPAAQLPAGNYPPTPTWPGPGVSPVVYAMPPPQSTMGHPGYFDSAVGPNPQSHLRQRFESRPSSAMGYQQYSPHEYYSPQEHAGEPPMPRGSRRPSRTRAMDEDRKRMPPPEFVPKRPQSAMPSTMAQLAPPTQGPQSRQMRSRAPPAHRRSLGYVEPGSYDNEEFEGGGGLFHDASPGASYEPKRTVIPRSRRHSTYDNYDYHVVPTSSRERRPSMYGTAALSTGGVSLDTKYNEALKYQEAVSGGQQMPLTAETLRTANNRGGVASSRSTRSSGSRDDSDYKRSNTTRSSYGGEDFTIKVSGGSARVRVQGAEIQCEEGGEITFSTRQNGSRSSSDRASTIYPQIEDARSRLERQALPFRPRAPSQSDSQTRGYHLNHAAHDPYTAGGFF